MVTATLNKTAARGVAENSGRGARSLPAASETRSALPTAADARADARFIGAKIWLQPLTPKKIAAQWYLSAETQQHCREMFSDGGAVFVLRFYRQAGVAAGGAAKTLEFEIDVSRRCCYLNLDAAGGSYTAELGLRCQRDRYIFISRSAEIKMLSAAPTADKSPLVPKKTVARTFEKPQRFVAMPVKTMLTADREIDWEWRDMLAEEQTAAVYKTFIDEGPRVLRQRPPLTPNPLASRKVALAARRLPAAVSAPRLAPAVAPEGLPVATLAAARRESRAASITGAATAIKYPPQATQNVELNPAKLATLKAEKRVISVKSQKLTDALVNIRDKAEIVLRGKVKKIGQRVRVGGLLIEPEADGTFCVACVIRDGKLFVPVADVEAVRQ
ncbi:MAG: DUF4912 domain-containing protein [Planctomycetota bacterium]|jgi:hypothetical protein|nr:DUF4912 domain-containing protein [Planctomycetota bacterium]